MAHPVPSKKTLSACFWCCVGDWQGFSVGEAGWRAIKGGETLPGH